MKINDPFKDWIPPLDAKDHGGRQLFKTLLEYRAALKEIDINKRLLGELVSKYASAEKRLRALNNELVEKELRLDADLKAAAEIQKNLLPDKDLVMENLEIAWRFEPCEHMGGDIFSIFRIDSAHVGMYMLDVSGHGVPAAMMTVSVSQFLQQNIVGLPKGERSVAPLAPARLFEALDEAFPFERFNNFFTITYVIVNTKNGKLTYGNAGHPYPILLRSNQSMELLDQKGPVIGAGDMIRAQGGETKFGEGHLKLNPGDRLFVYTDGIVEYQNQDAEFYGEDRFHKSLLMLNKESVQEMVDRCIESLMAFGNHTPPQDDITLLGLGLSS